MLVCRLLLVLVALCAAVAPARAISDEEERARAHFLAGQSYYDQASYADALKEFNEAYRISRRSALLYNIARCHEALDQYPEAAQMLERYLRETPDASDRAAIETRIANLKHRPPPRPGEPATPLPATTAPPPATLAPAAGARAAPAPSLWHRPRTWTWVAGGIGAGALAAALGTGVASQLAYDSLDASCPSHHCDPATVANAQSRVDGGRRLALSTDILWPVGAAAVASAVVLFFVEGRPAQRHAAVAAPFVAAPFVAAPFVAAPFVAARPGGLLFARLR